MYPFLYQANVYKHLGQWTAMSILQGGVGFPVFTPSVYDYIVNGDITAVKVTDESIPQPSIRHLVSLVRK